jgi:hypothetical protein
VRGAYAGYGSDAGPAGAGSRRDLVGLLEHAELPEHPGLVEDGGEASHASVLDLYHGVGRDLDRAPGLGHAEEREIEAEFAEIATEPAFTTTRRSLAAIAGRIDPLGAFGAADER